MHLLKNLCVSGVPRTAGSFAVHEIKSLFWQFDACQPVPIHSPCVQADFVVHYKGFRKRGVTEDNLFPKIIAR